MKGGPPTSGATLLRTGLFLGASLLAAAVFLFSSQAIGRLTREVQTTSRVLARFCAQASIPATRDPELQRIFSDLISGIEFPIVITDTVGTPRAWREIDVDPALVPAASLDSLEQGLPIAPVIRARVAQVRRQITRLDHVNPPISMTQPNTGLRLGAVHFGEPPVLQRLRWMPALSVGGVLVLLSLGLWGLASIRQADRRIIWVGMAKETAHQLGTPLSSLLGWIELMRSQAEGSTQGGEVRLARQDFDETLGEMERDVERLSRVAQRFSHVGSTPNLQLQDPVPVVREAVTYMRRRLPQGGAPVDIVERYEEVPPINLSRELLEWAVENLLSNAIDALDKQPARIAVTVARRKETETVEIMIEDNGRGMTPAEQRRALEPGYTTKRRGWGLGLALARRVVEEYHGGTLAIRHSAPGQGTVVVLSFPT
jgi:signal transduction histidine kinase